MKRVGWLRRGGGKFQIRVAIAEFHREKQYNPNADASLVARFAVSAINAAAVHEAAAQKFGLKRR